jgi:hypothetical protein
MAKTSRVRNDGGGQKGLVLGFAANAPAMMDGVRLRLLPSRPPYYYSPYRSR